jgi:hypothetical protein
MMDVKVVEKAKDVFGKSVSDFDPWEDGEGFVDDNGDVGFGDFGNFEAMDGENSNDDTFFKIGNSGNFATDGDDGVGSCKAPLRRPTSRRGHPSRNTSLKGANPIENKHMEKEGDTSSRTLRAPMRRRSSSRLLTVDCDDKKDSGRSRSRSADKDLFVSSGEGTGDDTHEKEHNRSGHSGRRDALRSQRNSFRLSKPQADEESPSTASREKSPKRGVNRRQSSSRRLMSQGEVSVPRLTTQQSVLSLFQNGDLGEEDKTSGSPGTGDIDGSAGCIVSHSRFQKPARSRSGMAKSLGMNNQLLMSPDSDPQRRVGKSTSMNRKLDGPPPDSGRPPPQRTRSAVTPRPGSIRRNLSSDNLALPEHPEENDDPLSPAGGRQRHPTKSKSTGAVSVRERRQNHKQEGDAGHVSLRRSHRRLGSQNDDLKH